MQILFKKAVASLTIFSLFWSDVAFCMQGDDEEAHPLARTQQRFDETGRSEQVLSPSPPDLVEHDSFETPSLQEGKKTRSLIPLKRLPKDPSLTLSASGALTDPLLEGEEFSDDDTLDEALSLYGSGPNAFPLQEFLKQMDWKGSTLIESTPPIHPAAFQKLLSVEYFFWPPRWVSVDHFLEKLVYFPLLNKAGVSQENPEATCDSRFWIHGRAIPMESKSALRKAVAINQFREGLEEGIFNTIHLALLGLLGYQLEYATPVNLMDTFRQADHNSVIGIANLMHHNPAFFAFLVVPFALGMVKALWNVGQGTQARVEDVAQAIESYPTGVCEDYLRPLFPLPPLDRHLPKLQRLLLWEGGASAADREKGFGVISDLAKRRQGYSQLTGLHSLARVTHGLHLKDYDKLKDEPTETLLQLLSMKTRSLEMLQETRKDLYQKAGINWHLINALYADYLLWSLGQSPSLITSVGMSLYKGGKLALEALFFKMIIETIIEYLHCPEKPGFTWTGYQPWASDYSENCFDELVREFNLIPGQPVSSLIDNLDQYYFPGGTYALDLSNKGLDGPTVLEIVQGFAINDVTLTSMNLKGNFINRASTFQSILPLLPSVRELSLSDNGIGNPNVGSSLIDTIVLAQSLGNLTSLTHLDLSTNWIGQTGSQGTVAIGKGLPYLIHLTSLDLSGNSIGNIGSQGTVAIGKGLPYLTHLTSLDLSNNDIGYTNSQGTGFIANSLRNLTRLTSLNLSTNNIGITDSQGTVAIGKSLPYLIHLTSLDLSNNWIGETGSQGVISLAQGLSFLKCLQTFNIQPQIPPINSTYVALFNQALAQTEVQSPIPLTLSTQEDVETYFTTLPSHTTSFNFSSLIGNPQVIPYLITGLRDYPFLTSLDLSFNSIGWTDSQGTVAIGKGLPYLTHLTSLDLSNNWIGRTDSQGTVAIGNGLKNLTSLISLDLSGNDIGWIDSQGAVAIGKNLQYLIYLTSLDLSNNYIGSIDSQGTVAIGNGLQFLSRMTSLSLSNSNIGETDSQGTVAIGNGLQYLTSLTSLDLSDNGIGDTDSQGTVAIGNGLQHLPPLTLLDLSINQIGYIDSNGTVAIANGLGSLVSLKVLQLSQNKIGSTDQAGLSTLVGALPKLSHLRTIGLAGAQNIPWTEGAQALASLRGEALRGACEAERCFNRPLHPASHNQQQSLVPISRSLTKVVDTPPHELSLMPQTSSASHRAQPMGQSLWRALTSYTKSCLSLDAWVDSAKKSAYHLAIERDPHTGQLVNTMPATFPNLLIPNHDRWTSQVQEDQLFLNASTLAGPPSLLPESHPLSVTP